MRSVGTGTPFILVNRFRGTLDTWDPAFIDALAKHYRVITFDYSGLGASTGLPPQRITSMANDAYDLARAMKIDKAILGGWSMGGLAAQTAAALHPGFVTHLVLIGTAPPGKNAHPPEKIFLERAHKPTNDLDDETVLFFEPRSPRSQAAAQLSHDRIAQRTTDLSTPVPPSAWNGLHQAAAEFAADELGVRNYLKQTSLPILVLSGDHDIVCPIENWYDLTRELPTTQFVVFPFAGHGPQHEYIEQSVGYIATFVTAARP